MLPFKMHKNYIFLKKKICVSTQPKIFRPVTRNTLIFLFGLIKLKNGCMAFYSALLPLNMEVTKIQTKFLYLAELAAYEFKAKQKNNLCLVPNPILIYW